MIAPQKTSLPDSVTGDCIVVVHGFSGKRLWMMPLCHRLRASGFRVVNWSYISFLGSIRKHAERLNACLQDKLACEKRVHIVAHSMGSIVVRQALADRSPPNLSRIVFVAPPHTGTPVARICSTLAFGKIKLFRDLSDSPNSLANNLPSLETLDCVTIAGRYGYLVPERHTHGTGARQQIVLNATHNSLLFSPTTARLAISFLSTGQVSDVPIAKV